MTNRFPQVGQNSNIFHIKIASDIIIPVDDEIPEIKSMPILTRKTNETPHVWNCHSVNELSIGGFLLEKRFVKRGCQISTERTNLIFIHARWMLAMLCIGVAQYMNDGLSSFKYIF